LSLSELGPNLRFVGLFSKLSRLTDVIQLVKNDLDGINRLVELLVDAKSLGVKLVVIIKSHSGELVTIIVVKSVDVVHNTACVSSDGCQDEQILQTLVLSEVRVVEHDSLKKLNKLVGQVGIDESSHGKGHFVDVLGLGKSSLHDLVDNLLSVRVLFLEDLSPKWFALTLNEITSLHTVEVVLVGDLNELIIALAPSTLIGSEGQIRVLVLAVFTDHVTVIELVVDQEALSIFAATVDVDLGESVVERGLLNTFFITGLEPLSKHAQLASCLKVLNEFIDRANSDGKEELLDVGFIAVKLKKGSEHLG